MDLYSVAKKRLGSGVAYHCARAIYRAVLSALPMNIYQAQRSYRRLGRIPALRAPQSFNDKVLFKLVNDRRPFLRLFADKLAVREFVRARLGEERFLKRLLSLHTQAGEIGLTNPLPNAFVVKPNHGSSWYEIFDGHREVDLPMLREKAASWLSQDFSLFNREWAYVGIPPMIMVEEYLPLGQPDCAEFQLFSFDGRVEFIRRKMKGPGVIFTREGKRAPFAINRLNLQEEFPPPKGLAELIDVAEALSKGVDFVRVDLYDIDGAVKFGELTNYPFAGGSVFHPPEWDAKLGAYWEIPERYPPH
jgi:hypothetical protein